MNMLSTRFRLILLCVLLPPTTAFSMTGKLEDENGNVTFEPRPVPAIENEGFLLTVEPILPRDRVVRQLKSYPGGYPVILSVSLKNTSKVSRQVSERGAEIDI